MSSFIPYNALLGVEKDDMEPENARLGGHYTCIINTIAWPDPKHHCLSFKYIQFMFIIGKPNRTTKLRMLHLAVLHDFGGSAIKGQASIIASERVGRTYNMWKSGLN